MFKILAQPRNSDFRLRPEVLALNEAGFGTPSIRVPFSRSLIQKLLDSWGQTEPLHAQISQKQWQLEQCE